MAGEKKKSAGNRSLYVKGSIGEMIDERADKAGSSFAPYVLDSAMKDMPALKNLPPSLQREVAICIFTIDKLLRHLVKNGESEWLQDTLRNSISETLAENEHADLALFEDEPDATDALTEIATAVLTIDAAVKAYLERAGLDELYEHAHHQSRIRVLNEMRIG